MFRLLKILFTYLQTKYLRTFDSREELLLHQQKLLTKQLKFLKKNSPFYKNITDFSSLPVMNKKLMMTHFDELNTQNIHKEEAMNVAIKSEESRDFSPTIGDISVGLSSGTSGNRGMFLVDSQESARWAGIILAKLLPEFILKPQKIALFLRANNNLYESLNSKRIVFKFFDLMAPLEQLLDELNEYGPTLLVSPPSMLRFIADKQESGGIHISPKKIFSAAEVLDPLDQKYLEKIFQQKIHQIYQCTEGFLGHTCDEGTIHLNEDFLIIEKNFIDENKTKFYPVITDLERKTQPIVRYLLNDILTLKKDPCPCRSPQMAIEQIEGREDDLFYFTDKKGEEKIVFPDFIRRKIISASDDIEEYRVVQKSPQEMTVYLKSSEKAKELTLQSLEDFFQAQNIVSPKIHLEPYHYERSLKKLKRVERLYS